MELEEITTGRLIEIDPVPKRRVILCGLARDMRVFNTRKGETAAFFTLDAGFASADISVNSDLYQTGSLACGKRTDKQRVRIIPGLDVLLTWVVLIPGFFVVPHIFR